MPQIQMTPEQALSLLDEIVGQVHMKRADHARAQTAVMVLQRSIQRPVPSAGTEEKPSAS